MAYAAKIWLAPSRKSCHTRAEGTVVTRPNRVGASRGGKCQCPGPCLGLEPGILSIVTPNCLTFRAHFGKGNKWFWIFSGSPRVHFYAPQMGPKRVPKWPPKWFPKRIPAGSQNGSVPEMRNRIDHQGMTESRLNERLTTIKKYMIANELYSRISWVRL